MFVTERAVRRILARIVITIVCLAGFATIACTTSLR